MTDSEILRFVKANLGLSLNSRDDYLTIIIKSAKSDLNGAGITREKLPELERDEYDMFLIDYSAWLYRNRGGEGALPRHLVFRKNNLKVKCLTMN